MRLPSSRTPNQEDLAYVRWTSNQRRHDRPERPIRTQLGQGRSPATNFQNFGEIDGGPGAEMDMTIIEVAFHDNVQDADLLNDPKVRDQMDARRTRLSWSTSPTSVA